MRFGVNLLYFRPGEVGGGEVYIRELLSRLAQEGDRCFAYCWAGAARSLAGLGRVEVRPLFDGRYSHARRLARELAGVDRELRQDDIDVLFSPANFAPLRVPARLPTVTTLHDLQHLWFPSNFTRAQRLYRSAMFRRTIARTHQFIAISDFTRADVIARLGVRPEAIHRVYSGAPELPDLSESNLADVRERYALPRRYFFYPAALWAHKNHAVLFEALSRVRKTASEHHLVLTGATLGREAWLRALARRHGVSEYVHHLGFVPGKDVLAVMSMASALVLPSRFEGFGLPALEAMRCHVPVLASGEAAIPEIVGNAGLLLDPDDVASWATALARIARDEALRGSLVASGLENLRRFSWDECARQTRDVLCRAVREGR